MNGPRSFSNISTSECTPCSERPKQVFSILETWWAVRILGWEVEVLAQFTQKIANVLLYTVNGSTQEKLFLSSPDDFESQPRKTAEDWKREFITGGR